MPIPFSIATATINFANAHGILTCTSDNILIIKMNTNVEILIKRRKN